MGLLDEAIREHLDLKRRRGADPSEVDRLEREALGPVRRAPHDVPDALLEDEGPAGSYPAEEELPYELDEAPGWSDAPAEAAPFDRGDDVPAETTGPGHWDEAEPATEIAPLAETDGELDMSERTYDAPRHHEIAEEWEAHERQSPPPEPAAFDPDEPAPAPPYPAGPAGEPTYPPAPNDPSGAVFGGERPRPIAPEQEYDYEQETLEHDVEAEELGQPPKPEEPGGEDVLEETPDFLQDTPDHDRLWFEQRPPRDFDFDE